jgi:lipopolysaccharide/colanic/teichoic acid biosynthesis glycosyltransferase
MNIPLALRSGHLYPPTPAIFTDEPIHPSVYSWGKRLVDILGSLVGLTVTALVVLPIFVALKLDSPGPIFFRQARCGLNGNQFDIWKFRSMVVGAEHRQHLVSNQARGHIFKNVHDPRITRVGKFLRRSSLDELPQFWNVLKGEMSLVGTRPPTTDEVRQYKAHHFRRLRVKPGLTGEWQVKGRSIVTDFEEIVGMDLDYQHKWSVGYDLYLIWRTFGVVLRGRGAC